MNKQRINQALNYLADKAIPDDYVPVPVIRKRIEAAMSPQQNQIESKLFPKRSGFAGLLIPLFLLAGTIFFLTPPGRAVAREVLRFFSFAESDVLPIQTGQPTEPVHPTRTPAPTRLAQLQEVTPLHLARRICLQPGCLPA